MCFIFRFIPNRTTTDMEYGHYALMRQDKEEKDEEEEEEEGSGENREYKDQLRNAMGAQGRKILNFRTKAPEPKSKFESQLFFLIPQNCKFITND